MLPQLIKASICIAFIGILLSCISIYLHVDSARLLRRADSKHRTFMNRMANARVLGDMWQIGNGKKRLDGLETAEHDQRQCRHRQKTEWTYHDTESVEHNREITVDFSATEVRWNSFTYKTLAKSLEYMLSFMLII